jgi:hypothetical protein
LIGTILDFGLMGNASADNLAGLILCNKTQQPFAIFCNVKAAPPINPNTCLPATWKDIATIPEVFGGTPQAPVTHLTCQWVSTSTGETMVSTVMDISDDHSGNFPSGKISHIVVSGNYSIDSLPNPVPQDYTPFILSVLKNK